MVVAEDAFVKGFHIFAQLRVLHVKSRGLQLRVSHWRLGRLFLLCFAILVLVWRADLNDLVHEGVIILLDLLRAILRNLHELFV